jgi:hypothetical protein
MENSGHSMVSTNSERSCAPKGISQRRTLGVAPILLRRPHLLDENRQSPRLQFRHSPALDLVRRSVETDLD